MEKTMKKNARLLLRRITALSLCLIFIGCTLAGCGGQEGGSASETGGKLTPVTLNEVAHSIFYAPMYVAIEEGYFAEEGIDLTLITGFGADKTMTAVLSAKPTSVLWEAKARSTLILAAPRTMLSTSHSSPSAPATFSYRGNPSISFHGIC